MEAEQLLSLAKKVAEEAEVFQVHSRRISVQFEANRLKQIQQQETTATALRLIKEGKIGFSAVGGEVEAQTLVGMAVETSQFGTPANFVFPSASVYPNVETFDPETEKVPIEKMVDIGEGLVAQLTEYTPDILCEGVIAKEVRQTRILNSKGGEVGYLKSLFSISLEGVVIRDTDMLFVGDSESSCRPEVDEKTIAKRVIEQLELARRKASVSTKLMPVIFTPRGTASAFIVPLMVAFNGKLVLEGASPLRNRQGEEVFDKKFSLWDDATIPYRPTSRPCDDEGVASQSTLLVEGGKVINFLYDLQTAALAKTRSTGNGNRSRGTLPAPSASCLILNEGNVSFNDMVKDMREGLVVEQLIGAEQGNVLGGDFSGNVLLGYKVEAGEIVGRVKDTMVAGNVYQVLKNLEAVSKERRWIGAVLLSPALYCPSLSVATKVG